jgi:hypothetical protein
VILLIRLDTRRRLQGLLEGRLIGNGCWIEHSDTRVGTDSESPLIAHLRHRYRTIRVRSMPAGSCLPSDALCRFSRSPSTSRHARRLDAAPMGKKLRDERVLVAGFDGQWRQGERYRQRRVIAERPRANGARVCRMDIVDQCSV